MKQKDIIKFNKRFANGEQYIYIAYNGNIVELDKNYYWQVREVYNIILPSIQMIKAKYPKVQDYQIYGKNGLVSQLIPIQKSYNNIKNRKQEYLNRLAYGILEVEDGSVDVENLDEEGLPSGKILVYRQGATMPKFLEENKYNYDYFDNEEIRLKQDRDYIISGFIATINKEKSSGERNE